MTGVAEQFNDALDVIPVVEGLVAQTRAPRCANDLLDLIPIALPGEAGALQQTETPQRDGAPQRGGVPHRGSAVLDAGAGDGTWAVRIRERFGCFVVAVDLADRPLRTALANRVPGTVGDLHRIPLRDESFDAIWCRDTLSCVPDPATVLGEFARLLRPGGGVVLYTAITTPRLEPRERAQLFGDLECPPWWHDGAGPVEEAIDAAGLDVVLRENLSAEAAEVALRECEPNLVHDLATYARLTRESASFQAALGPKWYGRWRAWMSWSLLLLLGKLQARAWVLRKPSEP